MIKSCRICGTRFTACNGAQRGVPGMPNWRQFCCTLDCASEYYAQIEASRTPQPVTASVNVSYFTVDTSAQPPVEEVTEAPAPVVDEAVEPQEEIIDEAKPKKRRKAIVED